ncbi:hypothetical protein HNQ92_000701 [Rhabdobacter roseus]|uniref:DUF3575 domain-containing protein n=1 Tax=Rhabdobacter roseus TaxID=1655419 RepID=A0A840TRB8_9BACT|nr:hypothetical protein [Rhabdobacter roseus]MBB5282580.1 hypothetical protein [Rhabdobacter roseus]
MYRHRIRFVSLTMLVAALGQVLLSGGALAQAADSAAVVRATWPVSLDSRTSFIDKRLVNVWGANIGYSWGKRRHKVTLGYYWLGYQASRRLIEWEKDQALRFHPNYYTQTDLYYVSPVYWYNFVNNDRWRLSAPVGVGYGRARALRRELLTEAEEPQFVQRYGFVPIHVGGYGEWKATRWAGISAQVGYRWALNGRRLTDNFNGMYYSVGYSVYTAFFRDWHAFLFKKQRLRSPFWPRRTKKAAEPATP